MDNDIYLDKRLLIRVPDRDTSREIFKKFVRNFNIEVSSYCNRNCGYCPVPTSVRGKKNEIISEKIFKAAINELKSIDYSESVCLNLYNEPTKNMHDLLEKIRFIRSNLPKSRIYFSTNGDFLNEDAIDHLKNAGLNAMTISIHIPDGCEYDDADCLTRIIHLSHRCKKLIKIISIETGRSINGLMKVDGMDVNVFSTNFYELGVNRAGSVKSVKGTIGRTAPCIRPFSDFTLSCEGNVFPCCQFFPGASESQRYIVGNVDMGDSIFDVYGSTAMAAWRRRLYTDSKKLSPCDTCGEINWSLSKDVLDNRRRFLDADNSKNPFSFVKLPWGEKIFNVISSRKSSKR